MNLFTYAVRPLLLGVTITMVGCGGSGESTNVGEDADVQALQEYEAQIAADEQASNQAEQSSP